MKKRLIKLLSLVLVVIMSLSAFACDLVTVDMTRADEQVVATVQVFDGAPKEEIKNKHVKNVYMTNGAYYIYTMGYTVEEALDFILDSIIDTKINVQLALNYFKELGTDYQDLNPSVTNVWDVERYLTAEEIAKANYNVKKSVNETIDSYLPVEEEDPSESYTETVRAVPTGAVNYERELTKDDMNDYKINRGIYEGNNTSNDTERRTAYYMLLKSMSENGYIDDGFDWKTDSVVDTEYYEDSVKEQMYNILLNKYNSYLIYDYYMTVSYEAIANTYEEIYKEQAKAKTYTEFNEMLTNASATNPVLANHFAGSFGYVYNLLIPMDSIQSAKLAELDKKDTADYRAKREAILANTTVKDLRNTWINAGYDFDYSTNMFLNDYAVAGANALPFQGLVEWTNSQDVNVTKKVDGDNTYFEYSVNGEVDDEYVPEYKAASTEMKFEDFNNVLDTNNEPDDFIELIETYLFGSVLDGGTGSYDGVSFARTAKTSTAVTTNVWKEKINELLFAFSSDNGSLNTYKGYPIAMNYEIDYTEKFVDEFAAAGRYLLDNASDYLNKGYVVVASDYGYHILFLSEVVTASNYETLEAYLTSLGISDGESYYDNMRKDIRDGKAEDYADSYLYTIQQSVAGTAASNYVNQLLSSAKQSALNNEDQVKIVRDNLKNIL